MGSEKIGPFCKYLNKAMQIWKIKISPSSLATKDCWVVTPENWVSKQILFTELGLYVRLSHPKAMSRLKKVSCKVGISKKPKLHVRSSLLKDKTKFDKAPLYKHYRKEKDTKLFSHKKEHIWCFVVEVVSLIWKTTLSLQKNHLFVVSSFLIAQ